MIGIIDYGLGNVSAFRNIYEKLDLPVSTIKNNSDFHSEIERFIFPGVGSFDWAMQLFNKSGLRDELEKQVLGNKRPILGVCVGMQILFDSSEEGTEQGLGWITGKVNRLGEKNTNERLLLPHMGWNSISEIETTDPLLEGLSHSEFYFLHSYAVRPSDNQEVTAVTEYFGEFASAVRKGNILGTQFHPEKSHKNGVAVLKNFGTKTF